MASYIVRRLFHALIVLILVTIIVFVAIRLLPGDPVYFVINRNSANQFTEEQLQTIRHEAGLDRPMVAQYITYMNDLFHGDFGRSIIYKTPVSDALRTRLPITLHVGILSFIVGTLIGVPMGVISAIRRGTWIDTVVTALANIGITLPTFWLGVMLIYVLALQFKLLPVMGYTSPFDDFWLSTKQLIMPVFCVAIWPLAGTARQTRSIILEIVRQDYIRTAWSKGLTERAIIIKHALKNGFVPLLTFMGLAIPTIIGGEVMIEMVFNIAGIGRLAVDSLFKLDYAYVQGIVLVVTFVVVLVNLLIDVSYGWIDPRIRYR
jgi:peptide/nickel transport system permease protein